MIHIAESCATDQDCLPSTFRPISHLFDVDENNVLSQVVDDPFSLSLPQSIEDIIYSKSPLFQVVPDTSFHHSVQNTHSTTADSVVSLQSELTSEATRVIQTAPPKRKNSFSCTHENCGRVFSKKWNLQAHLRLHTGEKPFACRLGCGEKHMWMSSLKSHEKRKCKLLPASARIRKRIRPRHNRHVVPSPVPTSPCGSFSSAVSEYQSSDLIPLNSNCFRPADQPSKENYVLEKPIESFYRDNDIVRELETILSSHLL